MSRIFSNSILQRLREMRMREMRITTSFSTGLRNALSSLRSGFFQSPTTPALQDTKIDLDTARALYYNTKPELVNGAFTAKNIVDGISDYIGVPFLSVGDEGIDGEINSWVQNYWRSELWQMYRNTLRDADSWVRLRLPLPSPLLSPDDEKVPQIEVIPSDRVTPYYNPITQELERVEILTTIYMEDEPFDPRTIYATGVHAHGREHEIIEIITKEVYEYWDATTNKYLDDSYIENTWKVVPCIQVFNDYDSALHGGSSELENVFTFFQPLHNLFEQAKDIHAYHANPKVQVQVKDVMNFIRNNFPDSIANGQFTGKVSWRDRDIFFMESDSQTGNESIGFVTATLGTNDSVSLMELVVDFMCMAAGVTESILFRAKSEGSTTSDEFERFKEKIKRKRDNFTPFIQRLIQLAMYVTKGNPKVPQLTWPAIDTQDEIDKSQAFNDLITALEVANRSKVLSRKTYRASIRQYVPLMKSDQEEEKDVQDEASQENQQQIDLQKKITVATASAPSVNGNGGGGTNSASRVRAALPLEVTTPPSQQ